MPASDMRVIILGANGLLGRALLAAVRGHQLVSRGRAECDISDYQCIRTIRSTNADIVLNAAAWTDVDGAENPANEPAVWATNRQGPANVRTACDQSGAKLIHFSTNEVFGGAPGRFYAEADQTEPGNAYGRSKRAGEVTVLANPSPHAVVRVSWLYGSGEADFPGKIIGAARRLGRLRVVNDEFGSPTWTADVAKRVELLSRIDCRGVWHMPGTGVASRYDWAVFLLRHADLDDVPIDAIGSKEWPRAATPPRHAVLKDTRLTGVGIPPMPAWRDSVKAWLVDSTRTG